MKNYRLTISSSVYSDLAEIHEYIARDNKIAAALLVEKITDQINGLLIFPERCPLISNRRLAKRGYRKLVVGKYLVFFRVVADEVIVHRVLHGKRDERRTLKTFNA